MPQSKHGDQRATFRSCSLLRKCFHPRNNLRPIFQALPCFRDVFSAPCSYSSIFSQKQLEFSTLCYSPKFTFLGKSSGISKTRRTTVGLLRAFYTGILPGQPVVGRALKAPSTPASSLGGAPPVGTACANLLKLPLTT